MRSFVSKNQRVISILLLAVLLISIFTFEAASSPNTQFLGVFGIVLVILAVLGYQLYSYATRGTRSEAYKALFSQTGLKPVAKNRIDRFQYQLPLGFNLFHHSYGTKEFQNVGHGTIDDLEITVFTFKNWWRVGRERRSYTYDVVCIQFNAPKLPAFTVYSESMWQRVRSLFGHNDIDFDSHPKFSRMYWLVGENEVAIRRVLTDEVIQYFEGITPPAVTEVDSYAAVHYRLIDGQDPMEIHAMFEDAVNIVQGLRKESQGAEII